MKAFKQLISLLCKDPRHQSWCLTVQAGRGISNQAGRNSHLRTHWGRSRWSWTWAPSGLAPQDLPGGSGVFGKAQLWFWLGLLLPKFASVALQKQLAGCWCWLEPPQPGFQDQILRPEEKGRAQSWPSVLGKLSSFIYICWMRHLCSNVLT